jgi:hypothetical protein
MLERILGMGLLLGIIVRDLFGYGRFDQAIMICGSLLGIIYLLGNWWTNEPNEKSTRTIIMSVLYGIASWSLTFTLTFKLLYLTGSDEMTIMSFILLVLAIGADLLTSINKSRVINPWTIWRLGILSACVIICYLVSEDYRISITYRNYPGFLKYYKNNKDKEPFYIIQDSYFNKITDTKKHRDTNSINR